MAEEQKWLHLFSSNIRELYVTDAVELLAAPAGFVYQFRYQEEHIQDDARGMWSGASVTKGGLAGTPVAVYYSMQHAANFHPAAYLPLRFGEVVDAFVEGKTYIVRFRLGVYAPLNEPAKGERRDVIVREFTRKLKQRLSPAFPDYADEQGSASLDRRSATLDVSPADLVDAGGSDEGSKFERVVRYMDEALGPHNPYLFFRIASIWKGDRSKAESLSSSGQLDVVAGNNYLVEVAHYQASSPPAGATLTVMAPEGMELLTPAEIPLSSRYDVVSLRLFPPFRDDEVQGELIVSAAIPAKGASVRLPLAIAPSATHSFVSPFLAVLGTFLGVVPATLGQSATADTKVWFAAAGVLLVSGGVWLRKSKGLSA